MAALSLSLGVDLDGLADDLYRLTSVQRALARRHGDAFRALDRDIDRWLDAPEGPVEHPLTDNSDGVTWVMFTSPASLKALLERAAALGVPMSIGERAERT